MIFKNIESLELVHRYNDLCNINGSEEVSFCVVDTEDKQYYDEEVTDFALNNIKYSFILSPKICYVFNYNYEALADMLMHLLELIGRSYSVGISRSASDEARSWSIQFYPPNAEGEGYIEICLDNMDLTNDSICSKVFALLD